MVIRESYLSHINKFLGAPIIKIITGMRRIGKSTILLQLKDQLIKDGIPVENIVHINMELFSYSEIKDASQLHTYVTSKLTGKTGKTYILIDEVQEIIEWERAVQSFLAENSADIILTGSNSHMLSSELATLLTGRYIEIPIYALSFKEYRQFRDAVNDVNDIRDDFVDYLTFGGLPGIHRLSLSEETTAPYLDSILDTLVLRDIVDRHKIRDVSVLNRILNFIMDSTGSLISIKRIADYLKSQGLHIGNEKVSQYIQYLCEASIIIKVPRYDIQGKRQMEYLDKYYLTDIGLRYPRMGFSAKRMPGTLETVVFHELLRRGYKVFIGVAGKMEIDFVAKRHNEVLYVQVTTYLTDESTIEREFGNLEKIQDNYKKIVVSIDEVPFGGRNGIQWAHIRDWLVEE